jgi:hypothetical protein
MAEVLDRSTGVLRHVSLRHVEDPLSTIHASLNYFPLYCCLTDSELLDPAIRGYGFEALLHGDGGRKVAVILNQDPRRRRGGELLTDIGFAVLSAHARVSLYFLLRSMRKIRAIRRLESRGDSTLLISPSDPTGKRRAVPVEQLYQQGRQSAAELLRFVEDSSRP